MYWKLIAYAEGKIKNFIHVILRKRLLFVFNIIETKIITEIYLLCKAIGNWLPTLLYLLISIFEEFLRFSITIL